eukprot:368544-Amphidinium_carterae.1
MPIVVSGIRTCALQIRAVPRSKAAFWVEMHLPLVACTYPREELSAMMSLIISSDPGLLTCAHVFEPPQWIGKEPWQDLQSGQCQTWAQRIILFSELSNWGLLSTSLG